MSIRRILDQIAELEAELQKAVEAQETRYRLDERKVIFEQAVRDAHVKVRMGIFRGIMNVRPQNFLTMPVIYGMIVPLVLFDCAVTLYQMICFPIYGIARVRHADYIAIDHQHLAYLNAFEKAHCIYCSYAVGMLAYAGEITSRTEQYFCPIKHARKVLGTHARYEHFMGYGDAENLHGRIEELRKELADKTGRQDSPHSPESR